MSSVIEKLVGSFAEVELGESHGQTVVEVPVAQWGDFAQAARDGGFEMLSDLTAVDWMRQRDERFQVIANVVSVSEGVRLRMVTSVPREEPTVASVTPIWPGADYAEREVYDMFGIIFDGHPDLTRILMPDEWEGHPLRKDFGVGSVPVQFKASNKVE